MRIAIDIQPFASPSAQRGIGMYSKGLLKEMIAQHPEHEYHLFNLYGDCKLENERFPDYVHFHTFYAGEDRYLLRFDNREGYEDQLFYDSILEGIFQTFIHQNKIDLFVVLSPFDVLLSYRSRWFHGTRLAAIVYDWIPLLFQEKYLLEAVEKKRYFNTIDFLKSADMLFAISQSVKEDTIRLTDIQADKVHVIHSGVDSSFCRQEYEKAEQDHVFEKYGIQREFMIFPSGNDFRKNTEGTIIGYSKLPEELRARYQMVITGGLPECVHKELLAMCQTHGVDGDVVITGFLPFEDMLLLYNCSKLVVFTSLYEGFGLPVLEAFACGKEVVTSNNSSLREVAEGAAVQVDPYSVDDIARGMREALVKEDFSEYEQTKKDKLDFYTWAHSVEAMFAILNQIKVEDQPPKEKMPEKKKKIAVYTLDYTKTNRIRGLIDLLASYCEVDVYTAVAPTEEADGIRVMPCENYDAKGVNYDAALYHFTDNEACLKLLPHLKLRPGTVILEDINLHPCVYKRYYETEPAVYADIVGREIDNVQEFLECLKGADAAQFVQEAIRTINVNRFVLNHAQKIIVLEEAQRAEILKKNISYVVRALDIPKSKADARQPAEAYDAILFGEERSYLTERAMVLIYHREILPRCAEKSGELQKIAGTLAYLLGGAEAKCSGAAGK